MCTVTLVLPQDYPGREIYEGIRPLAEPELNEKPNCFLSKEKLVWHNQGLYFLFSCQPRQLTLNAVSDYNPLIGSCPQPLDIALNSVAMDNVEKLVVKHRRYALKTSTGNLLLKELRRNLGRTFSCSRWAVKNYYGPLPMQLIDEHHRQLIAMAEQAIINPEKLILIASETENITAKTILLISGTGSAFKCRLSDARIRVTQASPPGTFSIHAYRNQEITITAHCLDRFATRILGQDPACLNPIVTEGEVLKLVKNTPISNSCQMGRTAFLNVSGCVFIGAISRGRLSLVTTYRETSVDAADFHRQVLDLLQRPADANLTVPAGSY